MIDTKVCNRCHLLKPLDAFPPVRRSDERADACYACTPSGMGKNAFGGHDRLDKLDLCGPSLVGGMLLDVVSNSQPECLLWLTSIQDACHNFLMWGLARNGSSAEEFWHDTEWIFRVRASVPETWADAPRSIRQTYWDHDLDRRVTRTVELTDAEIKFMCLDTLWGHLSFPMTLDAFCADLMAERRQIVRQNWAQIKGYLGLPGDLETWDAPLVRPTEPSQVEVILFHFNNKKRRTEALEEAA